MHVMPDTRRHRGPHPHDRELFAPEHWPALRAAAHDYSWLLSRDYAVPSALKVVGDRYRLTERQRTAVMRCSCSDKSLVRRESTKLSTAALRGAAVEIDGFNLLTTVEASLAEGILLRGRDGCVRDMASLHGSWRKVAETRPAATRIGEFLHAAGVAHARWLLDSPVSNSGRLATLLRALAASFQWNWSVETVPSPDAVLKESGALVVTADSVILDACERWCDVASELLQQQNVQPIDLRSE